VIRRTLIGVATVVPVVLLARTLAYATEPGPAARMLEQRAGGPTLPVLALVSLGLGAAVAVATCSLAALAVRERALLESRRHEGFAIGRVFTLAVALAVSTCLAGGLLESYVHWRAGLGWHGLHCLIGPVHRDLLPIETGLSLVAAAVLAAAAHVLAWMRRTFAALTTLPRVPVPVLPRSHAIRVVRSVLRPRAASARAPPLPA